jgi:hypothetical protein
MHKRQVWVGIVLLALLLLPTSCDQTQANGKSYSASHFDSTVTVEEGGSLLVTETIDFDFVGGPFTFVFRELPLDHTDGITVLEAKVDGEVYPVGENPRQVEISSSDPMRVEWHLEPTSDANRTVQLTYRVTGAVRQEEGADALHWQPLPDSYDYAIGESETVISYPATTSLVSEPTIEAGAATTQQSPNQVTFTAQDLEPNTPLVVSLRFAKDSLISGPPNWQVRQQANTASMPYWIGLALLILGIGAAGMAAVWRRHSARVDGKGTVMAPPSDLAPALAGALLTRGEPRWDHAQATIYHLAARGVLNIEELPEKKWRQKHAFALNLIDEEADLAPHEEGALEMLFGKKGDRELTVKFSEVRRKVTYRGWNIYKQPLKAEMEAAGFFSKSGQRAQKALVGVGILAFLLGIIGILTTPVWASTLGGGLWAVIIAVILLSVASIILGRTIVPLSAAGAETAERWKQFRKYIEAVGKGNQAVDSPTMFETYLPYATAFGLLRQWAKHFERQGWTETPEFFHLLPGTPHNRSWMIFLAMQGTFHTSGGSASGSAGAGAAGGGASGAG